MCTIAIQALTPLNRTSRIKLYKNIVRSRLFNRITPFSPYKGKVLHLMSTPFSISPRQDVFEKLLIVNRSVKEAKSYSLSSSHEDLTRNRTKQFQVSSFKKELEPKQNYGKFNHSLMNLNISVLVEAMFLSRSK